MGSIELRIDILDANHKFGGLDILAERVSTVPQPLSLRRPSLELRGFP
jgi:hypothetical protein